MLTTKETGAAHTILILVGALILIGAVSVALLSTSEPGTTESVTQNTETKTLPPNPESTNNETTIEPLDEENLSAETPMEELSLPEVDDEVVVMSETNPTPGLYTDYSADNLANAPAGDIILFFHADWCPSCRTLDKDVNANLSNIPSDVTILIIDYDTELELRKKYGVNRQHTLVQVDAAGNKIKTLTGLSNTLDQVIKQL